MAGFNITQGAEEEEEGVMDLLSRQFKAGMDKAAKNIDTLAKNTDRASTTPSSEPGVFYRAEQTTHAAEPIEEGIPDDNSIEYVEREAPLTPMKEQTHTKTVQSDKSIAAEEELARLAGEEVEGEVAKTELAIKRNKAEMKFREGEDEKKRTEKDNYLKSLGYTTEQEMRNDLTKKTLEEQGYIDQERQRLSTLKPENFWLKAGTEDKIQMGLAVILGAVGQGVSGSRSNAAITAMNNAINQDLEIQKNFIDRQIASLDTRRLDQKSKAKLHSKLLGRFDLIQEESFKRVTKHIDSMIRKTKNEDLKADLEIKKAGILKVVADQELKTGENLNTRITEQMQVPIEGAEPGQTGLAGQVAPQATKAAYSTFSSGYAKPRTFNEAQGAADRFLTSSLENAKAMDEIEHNATPEEWKKLQGAMKQIRLVEAERELAGVGSYFGLAQEVVEATGEEIFFKALGQKGGRYWRALMEYSDDRGRAVSGANVTIPEQQRERAKVGPSLTGDYASRYEGRNRRRNMLKSAHKMAGRSGLLYWQQYKKPTKKAKK